MTEALREVIRFLLVEVGLNRVDSRHDPMNPGSGRVMLKSGMTYEGTLRKTDRNNQGICDAAWYGLIREDYLNKKQKRWTVDGLWGDSGFAIGHVRLLLKMDACYLAKIRWITIIIRSVAVYI